MPEKKTTAEVEADKKAHEERIKFWTKVYYNLVGAKGGKPSKEALKLIEWAAKTKQMPSQAAFLEQMRLEDQESYLKTDKAQGRMAEIRTTLIDVFKGAFKMDDKAIRALVVKYQLGDPQKLTQDQFFRRYVMKSDLFKTMYPEFNAWLRQGTGKASLADPYGSFKNYTALRDLYTAEYQKKFGSAAAIPPDLLSRAMMGNWDLDSAQWLEAISSDSNWGNVQGYKDRVSYFKDQWAAIFGASEFKDLEPPADLMHKYGVGQMGFDEIFETSIRDSAAFRAAFPDFEAFSQATFERTGKPPGTIQIGDYLERRADYIEMYKAVMEDPDAMPDMAVLGTALANNWSNTQWELSIKKNDPAYKNTPAFKNKGAAFDNYWKRVFGENSVPDGGLRDEYVRGAFTDPSYLWDEIKGTSEFRSQYALWDSFAAAQNAQGNVVMDDPGLYKRYQKAFYDAFANQGITVPGGFDRMFFSSGIDPGDFAQNIEKFSEQGEAYKWQSGEAPDLATTAGIADKTAGGDIRKKLSEAIKQRQVYVQSKFTNFQTEEKNNQIAQKI